MRPPPRGPTGALVAFDPLDDDQTVSVIERYGPRGRRMTGPQVVDHGGGLFRAPVTETVTVR